MAGKTILRILNLDIAVMCGFQKLFEEDSVDKKTPDNRKQGWGGGALDSTVTNLTIIHHKTIL